VFAGLEQADDVAVWLLHAGDLPGVSCSPGWSRPRHESGVRADRGVVTSAGTPFVTVMTERNGGM
jgi:hypothetical protein